MVLEDGASMEEHEDLRLAVVLNGGVSLAVWIGGVVREIHRLASSADDTVRWAERSGDDLSVYRKLLDLVRATARVDVIAGTSAGGINGALLAFATAWDVDLGPLRICGRTRAASRACCGLPSRAAFPRSCAAIRISCPTCAGLSRACGTPRSSTGGCATPLRLRSS